MERLILMMLLLALYILLGAAIYFYNRNNKVYEFFTHCLDLSYDWNVRHIEQIAGNNEQSSYDWFYGKLPEYQSLVFSTKKLELKMFFTEDEINKIHS